MKDGGGSLGTREKNPKKRTGSFLVGMYGWKKNTQIIGGMSEKDETGGGSCGGQSVGKNFFTNRLQVSPITITSQKPEGS